MANTVDVIDPSLYDVAQSLRRFVLELQRPHLNEQSWYSAAHRQCLELFHQMRRLSETVAAKHQTLKELLSALAQVLWSCAGELKRCCSGPRLREIRSLLASKYEEFAVYLRAQPIVAPREEATLKALRLPKLPRAFFHAGMGLLCVLLYSFVLDQRQSVLVLGACVATALLLETAKRFSTRLNHLIVDHLFKHVIRPRERYQIVSGTYYLLALLLITMVCPKPAVCLAILVLAVGDPVASFAGQRWGRVRFRNDKSLAGCLAFFGASLLASSAYLFAAAPLASVFWSLVAATIVSLVGTLTEAFSNRFDDNFTIPVACAFAGSLLL